MTEPLQDRVSDTFQTVFTGLMKVGGLVLAMVTGLSNQDPGTMAAAVVMMTGGVGIDAYLDRKKGA